MTQPAGPVDPRPGMTPRADVRMFRGSTGVASMPLATSAGVWSPGLAVCSATASARACSRTSAPWVSRIWPQLWVRVAGMARSVVAPFRSSPMRFLWPPERGHVYYGNW